MGCPSDLTLGSSPSCHYSKDRRCFWYTIGVSIQSFKYSKLTKNKAGKAAAQNLAGWCASLSSNVHVRHGHIHAGTHVCLGVKIWASVAFSSSFYALSSGSRLLLHPSSRAIQGKQHLSFRKAVEAICDFDKADHFTLESHAVSPKTDVINKPQTIA